MECCIFNKENAITLLKKLKNTDLFEKNIKKTSENKNKFIEVKNSIFHINLHIITIVLIFSQKIRI